MSELPFTSLVAWNTPKQRKQERERERNKISCGTSVEYRNQRDKKSFPFIETMYLRMFDLILFLQLTIVIFLFLIDNDSMRDVYMHSTIIALIDHY